MSRTAVLQKLAYIQVAQSDVWMSPLDMAIDCRDYRYAHALIEVYSATYPVDPPEIAVFSCPTLAADPQAWTLVKGYVLTGPGHTTCTLSSDWNTTRNTDTDWTIGTSRISGYLRLGIKAATVTTTEPPPLTINLRALVLLKEQVRPVSIEWQPPFQMTTQAAAPDTPPIVMPQDRWLDCTAVDDIFVLFQWDVTDAAGMQPALRTGVDFGTGTDAYSDGVTNQLDVQWAVGAPSGKGPMYATLMGLTNTSSDSFPPGPIGKAWLVYTAGSVATGSVRAWALTKQGW